MPSCRQTQKFLMRRFAEVGIRPNARNGQSFLIDLNLLQLLYETAQIGPHDVVLEVGTGTGSLTALLAQRAAAVITVEIDRQLHQLASEELAGLDNVTLLNQDALKNKNTLHPALLAAVGQKLAEDPQRRLKLVANLPYNVATPVISNLLASPTVPQTMTVTIQKELADRIVARPGTKDYGALSIWLQSQCEVQIVRNLPPSVFWPRPKVTSSIIHVRLREALRQRIADLEFFHAFVRAMFFHRRKFLRSVLLSAHKGRLDKQDVDALLAALHLDGRMRAEQLDVETMLALCDAVRGRLAESSRTQTEHA